VVTDAVVGRFVHSYEVADRAAAIHERYG
jgi:hypothetical protein